MGILLKLGGLKAFGSAAVYLVRSLLSSHWYGIFCDASAEVKFNCYAKAQTSLNTGFRNALVTIGSPSQYLLGGACSLLGFVGFGTGQ
jgi:hypothetical protein